MMKGGFIRWVTGRGEMVAAIERARNTPLLRKETWLGHPDVLAAENAERQRWIDGAKRLDPATCSSDDVVKELGPHWAGVARLDCDGCGAECGLGRPHEDVVRLGEDPDYETRWVDLCPDCVAKLGIKAPAR